MFITDVCGYPFLAHLVHDLLHALDVVLQMGILLPQDFKLLCFFVEGIDYFLLSVSFLRHFGGLCFVILGLFDHKLAIQSYGLDLLFQPLYFLLQASRHNLFLHYFLLTGFEGHPSLVHLLLEQPQLLIFSDYFLLETADLVFLLLQIVSGLCDAFLEG